MTDAFANLVCPVIQHVVHLQQRLEQGEHPSIEAERMRILSLMAEGEQKAGSSAQLAADFGLAKFALACWIDEILINSSWKHADAWRDQILEWTYFQSRERANLFYDKADEVYGLAGSDPLETFYLCVALGFRGKLVDSAPELQKWGRRVYDKIVKTQSQPDKFLPDEPQERFPLEPLPGKSILLAVSVLVSITVLITLVCFFFAFSPLDG